MVSLIFLSHIFLFGSPNYDQSPLRKGYWGGSDN